MFTIIITDNDENISHSRFTPKTILDFTEDLNEDMMQNWRSKSTIDNLYV